MGLGWRRKRGSQELGGRLLALLEHQWVWVPSTVTISTRGAGTQSQMAFSRMTGTARLQRGGLQPLLLEPRLEPKCPQVWFRVIQGEMFPGGDTSSWKRGERWERKKKEVRVRSGHCSPGNSQPLGVLSPNSAQGEAWWSRDALGVAAGDGGLPLCSW